MSNFLSDSFSTVSNGNDLTTDTDVTWTPTTNNSSLNAPFLKSANGIFGGGSTSALYTAKGAANLPPNANYSVSGRFYCQSLNGNNLIVCARFDDVAHSGYGIGYRPFRGFNIFRIDGAVPTALGTQPAAAANDMSVGHYVDATLTVTGSTLSATIVSDTGTTLATWSATDSMYSSKNYMAIYNDVPVTSTTGIRIQNVSAAAANFAAVSVSDSNNTTIASGSTVSLGTVNQGQSATATYTVKNPGVGTALTVGTLTVSGSVSLSADGASGASINPTGGAAPTSASFTISVNTTVAGSVSGAVSIPSNDAATPYVVNFTASVVIPSAPNAPTLSASATSSSAVNVTWTPNSSNQTGYKLERSPDGTSYTQIAAPSQGAVSYGDTSLVQNTTYYYRIRATNGIGDSPYSNTVSVSTPLPGVPLAPTNLVATPQNDVQVNLMWDLSDATDMYLVLNRSSDGGATWQNIVPPWGQIGAGEGTFNDPSCWPATAYQYRIAAGNGYGLSPWSNVTTVSTKAASGSGTPTINGVTALTPWSAKLSWTAVEGHSHVERSLDGVNYQIVFVTPDNATASTSSPNYWIDRYLPEGGTATYRVRDFNSRMSAPTSVTLPARTAGTPLPATAICVNTYSISLGGASAGSYTLTVTSKDAARQQVTQVTASISTAASASQLQAILQASSAMPYGSNVYVAGGSGSFVVGFTDGFTVLSAGTSSLTGGTLTVTENQTATNTTLVVAEPNAAGTIYHVETAGYTQLFDYTAAHAAPTNDGPFTFTEIATVTSTGSGIVTYNLATTAETLYYVRLRPSNANGYGGYAPHVRVVSPSTGTALTVDIGTGQTYASIGAFDWTTAGPGSTIRIHGKATVYTNFLVLPMRGTPAKPYTIVGVDDGNGLPIFDVSTGASYDNSLNNGQFRAYNLGAGDNGSTPAFEGHCITIIRRQGSTSGYTPGYFKVSGLVLKNANVAGGSFSGWNTSGTYISGLSFNVASMGVYVMHGDYVTLDNLTITGCGGGGIFGAGGGNAPVPTCDFRSLTYLTVQACKLSQNATSNNSLFHNVYLEGVFTTYVANRLGALVTGSPGNHGIKDRGAGTVFLYNDFEDGANYGIDLVEPQNYCAVTLTMPEFRWAVEQGNRFSNPTASFVHFCGDHANTVANRRGILYSAHSTFFFANVVSHVAIYRNIDSNATSEPVAVVDARNNIYYYGGGQTLGLLPSACIGRFGTNWVSQAIVNGDNGTAILAINASANFIRGGSANNPGFVSAGSADLRLATGSSCIDQAARLPAFLKVQFPLNRQYTGTAQLTARAPVGGTYDLGYSEYNTNGSIVPSTSTVERGLPFTITITGTSSSFTNGCFQAVDGDGNAVALTTNTASTATAGTIGGIAPASYPNTIIVSDTADAFATTLTVVDTAAPTVTFSIGTTGSTLTATFSESVRGVNAADFSLSGPHARTLGAASGSGTTFSFPMSPKGFAGETYTASYSGSGVVDIAGNALVTFTGRAVANNSTVTVDYIPPAVPGSLSVTAGIGKNDLTWGAVGDSDIALYNVYRDGSRIASINAPTTAYVDAPLVSGNSYLYTVSSVDTNGNESAPSGSGLGVPLYPAAPTSLLATTTEVIPTISWSPVSVANGTTKYKVERSADNGNTYTTVSVAQASTSFSDSAIASGNYMYRITALDAAGNATLTPPTVVYTGGSTAALSSTGNSRQVRRGRV